MTCQSATPGGVTSADAEKGTKAVLFCPSCRYRGKWTDWYAGEDAHALCCPSCGATIG